MTQSIRSLAIQQRDHVARLRAQAPADAQLRPELVAAADLAGRVLALEVELDLTCRLHMANAIRDRLRGHSDAAEMVAFAAALVILQRINPEATRESFFAPAATAPRALATTHPAPRSVQ